MSELEKKVNELEKKIEELSKALTSKDNSSTAIVMFSDDMDRVIAALNIAIGNLALGKEVCVFFTFWGVPLLKNGGSQSSPKHIVQRLFGWMLPNGVKRLSLSKMNFFGIGPLMMKFLMKKQQSPGIQELLDTATALGVKLYICTMSMDLMGIKEEELVSEPKLVHTGVAGFMQIVDNSSLTLFI